MKKYLTIAITLFALTIAFGQDQITWNEVGVVAKDGYANNIVQTMDNFYGNIEMPEGVSVSITAVYHSDENHKATHYLNFAGTIEGLVKLRELDLVQITMNILQSLVNMVKLFQLILMVKPLLEFQVLKMMKH